MTKDQHELEWICCSRNLGRNIEVLEDPSRVIRPSSHTVVVVFPSGKKLLCQIVTVLHTYTNTTVLYLAPVLYHFHTCTTYPYI